MEELLYLSEGDSGVFGAWSPSEWFESFFDWFDSGWPVRIAPSAKSALDTMMKRAGSRKRTKKKRAREQKRHQGCLLASDG